MKDMINMINDINNMEDMASYIVNMKIKKAMVGGFDQTDVYLHLQELHEMYQQLFRKQTEDQRKQLEEQAVLIEDLKEKLDQEEQNRSHLQVDLEKSNQKLKYAMIQQEQLQREVEKAVARSVEVPVEKPLEKPASTPIEIPVTRPVEMPLTRPVERPVVRPEEQEMETDITAILEEAYKSRNQIVEKARIEAERDGIQIRAGFRKEREAHEQWRAQMLIEQNRAIDLMDRVILDLQSAENKVNDIKSQIINK